MARERRPALARGGAARCAGGLLDPLGRLAWSRRPRAPLAAALGLAPERIAIARQVHGAELDVPRNRQNPAPLFLCPDSGQRNSGSSWSARADGHVVTEPGLAALVFVADCLPVALAGPGGVGDPALRLARARRRDRRHGAPRRSARPTPRSAPESGPAATRLATRCSARSPTSATGSPRAGCSTWPRSPGDCCARRGSSRSKPPGSARAARRSCSSPTAATADGPGARRASSGLDGEAA